MKPPPARSPRTTSCNWASRLTVWRPAPKARCPLRPACGPAPEAALSAPDIEQGNLFVKYNAPNTVVPSQTATTCESVKTYCAPLDASNPGTSATIGLTSYASNAAVFGVSDGGTARYPAQFNAKGTSNTVIFFERFASTGTPTPNTIHYWRTANANVLNLPPTNYVYAPYISGFMRIPDPTFGLTFNSVPAARDATAHAFTSSSFQAGLADGSARSCTTAVTGSFPVAGVPGGATIWSWACIVNGPIGNAPTPSGW